MSKEELIGRLIQNEELKQVIGGAEHNGVILVGAERKFKCPDCSKEFDTMEEMIRHSNEHYHAVIL